MSTSNQHIFHRFLRHRASNPSTPIEDKAIFSGSGTELPEVSVAGVGSAFAIDACNAALPIEGVIDQCVVRAIDHTVVVEVAVEPTGGMRQISTIDSGVVRRRLLCHRD